MQPDVVELRQQLSETMSIIQLAVLDIIKTCVTELKTANPAVCPRGARGREVQSWGARGPGEGGSELGGHGARGGRVRVGVARGPGEGGSELGGPGGQGREGQSWGARGGRGEGAEGPGEGEDSTAG